MSTASEILSQAVADLRDDMRSLALRLEGAVNRMSVLLLVAIIALAGQSGVSMVVKAIGASVEARAAADDTDR